jgi:Tfp pilus assembly protein PilZ
VIVRGKEGLKEVRNFGLYGVFVETENPSQFKSGDEIYLAMKLPREKKAVQVKGRVAHISERGIGVEIIDLPPKDAMSMELCFNVFKHTVPLPGS